MSDDIAVQVPEFDLASYLRDENGQPILTEEGEPLVENDAVPTGDPLVPLAWQE